MKPGKTAAAAGQHDPWNVDPWRAAGRMPAPTWRLTRFGAAEGRAQRGSSPTGLPGGSRLQALTAAGISAFIGMFFVIPSVDNVLPASLQSHLAPYLPFGLEETIYGNGHDLAHPLAPWTAFGVLCAYAVILTGFAAWRLRRADA